MNEESPNPENTQKIDMPVITSLEMSASELHEMFLALRWSGFDERQSLYIIGIAVYGGVLSAYRNDSEEDDPLEGGDDDDYYSDTQEI
jgi:hypothetical protein